MADLTVKVDGVKQTVDNLRSLTKSNSEFVFYLRVAILQACRILQTSAVQNAMGLGLSATGEVDRPNPDGRYIRYGRIPRSIAISKASRLTRTNAVLAKVFTRSQNRRGIIPDRAPHAVLIERGFTAGRKTHVAGRPFMAPAARAKTREALNAMSAYLTSQVDRLTFKRGPGNG